MIFDITIIGGGCAGISMIRKLLSSKVYFNHILLIEPYSKSTNDRSWCYWGNMKEITPTNSWKEIGFCNENNYKKESISGINYHYLKSLEYYKSYDNHVSESDRLSKVSENLVSVKKTDDIWELKTDQGSYKSRYVFNSVPRFSGNISSYHLVLKQHFYGYFLKSAQPVFDTSAPTLMDFRVSQGHETRFFYILPFSDKEALVEFTVFGKQCYQAEWYQKYLEDYIKDRLGILSYEVLEVEKGVIPMTNQVYDRNPAPGFFNIGTAGGMTKATTGYTFKTIQTETAQLVQNWEQMGYPQLPDRKRTRFWFYDGLLLHLMEEKGYLIKGIMSKLFLRNDFKRILRFLDEESSLADELKILSSLPFKVFIKALIEVHLLKPMEKYLSKSRLGFFASRSKKRLVSQE